MTDAKVINLADRRPPSLVNSTRALAAETLLVDCDDGEVRVYVPNPPDEFDGWAFTPEETRGFAKLLLERADDAERER